MQGSTYERRASRREAGGGLPRGPPGARRVAWTRSFRLTTAVHSASIAAILPEGTVVELEGVGHCAPIEAHSQVTRVIRALADWARSRGNCLGGSAFEPRRRRRTSTRL